MKKNFPKTAEEQALNCIPFSIKMKREFPELTLRYGCVYSEIDPTNCTKYPTQYPHAWLTTEAGEIVDPTVKQFQFLGPLQYEVWEEPPTGRCSGCGRWHYKDPGNCGECEWSEEESAGEPLPVPFGDDLWAEFEYENSNPENPEW